MRWLSLAPAAFLILAAPAGASGVFLKWNACSGAGGVSARSFACDTNLGFETLVCSAVVDTPVSSVTGIEARVVGQSAGGSLAPWWLLAGAGACRNAASSQPTASPANAACPNLFGADAVGGLTYLANHPGPGGVQFRIVSAVPIGSEVTAETGREYFLFSLRISHVKTAGTGACPGCFEPMCLGVAYLSLVTEPGSGSSPEVFRMNGAPVDQGHLVSWQGSAPGGIDLYVINPDLHLVDFAMTCELATRSRSSSWGSIKSLYR